MLNQGLGCWPARRARRTPHRTAISHRDKTLTYGEFFERVTRLASSLRSLGVRRGDRVAYLGPNVPSLLETLFASHTLGAVFVPLNTRLAAPELRFQLEDSASVVLIHTDTHSATARAAADGLALSVIVDGQVPTDDCLDYQSVLRSGGDELIDVPVDGDDPALILYTSGTTGRPKGATLTHANIIANCFNVLIDVDIAADEVTLVSAPMFHVAALNMTMLPTFLKGGNAVLMSSWNAAHCFELIERHRVTFLFGVPSMFSDLTRSPLWEDADLSSIRLLMAGGAAVPPGLIATYQQRGLLFLQGYGLTEAAPGTLIVRAEASASKLGSAGVPHFFTDVRVVRPDLTDAAEGEPGEILIHGPTIMSGYWRRPDATSAVLSDDGWLHSGDVAVTDADGYLYIIDRIKDMYVSGGENVYPAEVEAVLQQHPSVAECAVIGIPDEKWGEVGRAYVRTHPESDVTGDDLIASLNGLLARYKIPKTIEFVAALPRTSTGKIIRHELRRTATGE